MLNEGIKCPEVEGDIRTGNERKVYSERNSSKNEKLVLAKCCEQSCIILQVLGRIVNETKYITAFKVHFSEVN